MRLMVTYHYALKAWYIGTEFAGSQRQPNQRTIENELINALIKRGYITSPEDANFKSAVRTDACVHARSAVFSVDTNRPIILGELDAYLPEDMGVWAMAEVNATFQPRYDARHKTYYYIYPKIRNESINLALMRDACMKLIGVHDFTLLSKTNPSTPEKNTLLEMIDVGIQESSHAYLFKFQAKAFLWQSIRRTVALLLAIGRMQKSMTDLDKIFDPIIINNPQTPRLAPESPDGLILWQIEYDPKVSFSEESRCIQRMKKKIREKTVSFLRIGETFSFFDDLLQKNPKET